MKRPHSSKIVTSFVQWFDAKYVDPTSATHVGDLDRINWIRCLPFVILQLGCLGVFWVGWSRLAVQTAIGLYLVRMFAITGIYHRYFSHRTFRTSRWAQFAFAIVGASSVQRGPLVVGGESPESPSVFRYSRRPAFTGPAWILALSRRMVHEHSPLQDGLSSHLRFRTLS